MMIYFAFSNKKRQFKISASNNEEIIQRNNKVGKLTKNDKGIWKSLT